MIATFIAFAAFPVAVVLAHDFATLVVAFVVGGLREIGEPSRKAMIVDFAVPHLRARTVGLYYLIRSLSISPAAAIGGRSDGEPRRIQRAADRPVPNDRQDINR